MKVYAPILMAIGTCEFEVPDNLSLNDAVQYIKDNDTKPTHIIVDELRPNLSAARLTEEFQNNYDQKS